MMYNEDELTVDVELDDWIDEYAEEREQRKQRSRKITRPFHGPILEVEYAATQLLQVSHELQPYVRWNPITDEDYK